MAGRLSFAPVSAPVRTATPSRPRAAVRRGAHTPQRPTPARPLAPGARSRTRSRGVAYPHRRSAEQLFRFAQLLAEALAGVRPAAQLRPVLSRRAYEQLARRAGAYACPRRPRVLHTVHDAPASDIAEVSAVIDCGTRCRAVALRIAYAQHAWLCTHIETDLCRPAAGR